MYGVVCAIAAFIILLNIHWTSSRTGKEIEGVRRVVSSGLFAVFIAAFAGVALMGIARAVLPAFEILASGQPGRGRRVLAFLGLQALAILTALFFFLLDR